MMAVPSAASIEAAWVSALRTTVAEPHGRLLHLAVPVSGPAAPDPRFVDLLDSVVVPKGHHEVSRVASTVFPSSCYSPPELSYAPGMPRTHLQVLDAAAADLYARYAAMLPVLQALRGNSHGTYFGRMVSWPGKTAGGYNQLAARVRQLRYARDRGVSAYNAADMTVDGTDVDDAGLVTGLREYAVDDERTQGFPCLVHVDISVMNNTLNLMAVYRHWHLVRKAYGNLIGLTRLQHFLAQQSGYEVGELLVHATVANAELGAFSQRTLCALADGARKLAASLDASPTTRPGPGHDAAHPDRRVLGGRR
jgi:hypothetical protein